MSIKPDTLVKKYVKAIQDGRAAIFAGAGLSRASGFVDWKELLRPLAAEIDLNVDKETDLLSIAQYYKNDRKTSATINQTIIDAFSKDVDTNENIRILSRLPISTYWTTNYDELLETGIREAHRNPDVKSESDQLTQIKPERDVVVFKMHGDVNMPSNAVLTKSDYELYSINRPLFRTALQGDLVTKVFLFIGFSFEDPNLNYVLSQIHSLMGNNMQEHFCFFRRVQRKDYKKIEEYNYEKAKQEKQIDNLKNYGIQTAFVDSYDEITVNLRKIEAKTKLRNVFISGAIERYKSPWSESEVDRFSSQLASKLVDINCRITSGFGLGIGSSVINGALESIYKSKYRHVDKYLCLRPFPQNISDPSTRAEKWRKYREEIVSSTGVSIFMFGNKINKSTGRTVKSNGCLEEYALAKEHGHIIIPIGSTGYAAKVIFDDVKKNITDYPYLKNVIDDLERETDIDKLIDIIIGIIKSTQV